MQLPTFNNQLLLKQALTHRSAINEGRGDEHNERLEFLGDAVLELIVSEFVFKKYPKKQEGPLTQARTALVRTETLAQLANQLGIYQKITISKGEEKDGGKTNPSLLADATEAIIGALYLDQGLAKVKEFLSGCLLEDADSKIEAALALDAKSKLQEIAQAKGHRSPIYRIIKKVGPDHQKIFTAQVIIAEKPVAAGSGKSKQDAEQAAAKAALNLV